MNRHDWVLHSVMLATDLERVMPELIDRGVYPAGTLELVRYEVQASTWVANRITSGTADALTGAAAIWRDYLLDYADVHMQWYAGAITGDEMRRACLEAVRLRDKALQRLRRAS